MAFKLQNQLGLWGERIAEQEYLKLGYVLVARNIYNGKGKRLGEIDLVMRTDKVLVFVEVKTRRPSKFGMASESVTRTKQKRLIKIVHWFTRCFPQYASLQPQIDVCAIDVSETTLEQGDLDNAPKNVIIIPSAVTLDY